MLVLTSIFFSYYKIHKQTWTSPDGATNIVHNAEAEFYTRDPDIDSHWNAFAEETRKAASEVLGQQERTRPK
uniref:Uncharacterized protein n=1 Tax=Megaselia scalaris TaxID=36166 RepID=T1GPD1_MEGSC